MSRCVKPPLLRTGFAFIVVALSVSPVAMASSGPYTSELISPPLGAAAARRVRGLADVGSAPVQAVGWRRVSGDTVAKAAYWQREEPAMWLESILPGLAPAQDSWANDVERQPSGVTIAVGAAVDSSKNAEPMLWRSPASWPPGTTPPWQPVVLGHLPGMQGEANDADVNTVGLGLRTLVVGWSENAIGVRKATAWVDMGNGFTTGTMDEDDFLPPDRPSWAIGGRAGIADFTYLGIGAGRSAGGQTLPAVWKNDGNGWTTDVLPLLAGGSSGEGRVAGVDSTTGNLLGAGVCTNALGDPRPVLWTYNGVAWSVEDLGVLPGDNGGAVLDGLIGYDQDDILSGQGSESMVLVGWSANGPPYDESARQPVIWRESGGNWTVEAAGISQAAAAPYEASAMDIRGHVALNAIPNEAVSALAVADSDTTHTSAYLLIPEPTSGVDDIPRAGGAHIDAHPNPFEPAVTVTFSADTDGPVVLAVFDAAGRRTATLFDGVARAGVTRSVAWDGRSDTGEPAPPGVYFLRLATTAGAPTRKVLMMK